MHYPTDVIVQCVRWYLAYALSLRNLEEMMAERVLLLTIPRFIGKRTAKAVLTEVA
ncbi:IS6 family transposase [Serratia sp. JSRIV001]|nr:IS6 family transposase [Serratia sp. JSRIV001]UAN54459.1 IS6 family transposase [Serratia sp. JSRIV002]UAN60489.1 IS6 family transposase [Serratia sp. JSRIV004]